MTDRIFIRNLACEVIVGVLPEERQHRQPLVINLEITTDAREAAAQADLEKTIDYAKVAREVTALAVDAEAFLLETLAENIAGYVLGEDRASAVRVTLDKPEALASAETVGVSIYRER